MSSDTLDARGDDRTAVGGGALGDGESEGAAHPPAVVGVAEVGASSQKVLPSWSWLERTLAWFGEGENWYRPSLTVRERRNDVVFAVALAVFSAVSLELIRSLGMMAGSRFSVVEQHAMLLVGFVPLVWRRRFPVPVAIVSQVHFLAVGLAMPAVSTMLVLQVIFVVSIYTALGWARCRAAAAAFSGAMGLYLAVLLAWSFAKGNASDQFLTQFADTDRGLIGPLAAALTYMTLINVAILVVSVVTGRNAWWAARDRAEVAEQAATIARQADELREQAVIGERLRIARELHDVVAHQVAVTGVQAAAARKALGTRPDLAEQALGHVEEASRTAVTEMRALLGTLRRGGHEPATARPEESGTQPVVEAIDDGDTTTASLPPNADDDRVREPSLGDLPALVDSYRGGGLDVRLDLVGGGEADLAQVPDTPALAAFRIVQESLTNVTRHSTATTALVVVRFLGSARGDASGVAEEASSPRPGGEPRVLEVEVTDNGRPRQGTSGSGLGQLGMRERVQVTGGTIDVGPRTVGGYRVRARIPLQRD